MKTLVFSIIITLALGINLLQAATFPNRFTTNADNSSALFVSQNTNTDVYASKNNVLAQDRSDLDGMYDALASSGANFVDGILFQPRFGTNTSLAGRPVVGYRGNYTPDSWGVNITNTIGLQLPNALSNLTVVVLYRSWPFWLQTTSVGGGGVVWGLSNTNTQSGICVGASEATADSRWLIQETYRLQQWPGAGNGSYSNLFQPLRMFVYDWNGMGSFQGCPLVVAWQRDASGAWRMYLNTVQGEISLNNPALVYHSPTNATDPLSYFTMGYDGITNEPNLASHTNVPVAAVFVFGSTNYSAVVAGYQAAFWTLQSDRAEFWYGDSRLNDPGVGVYNVATYYQRRLAPSVFFFNHAQGGARADTFVANFLGNGGFGEVTNVPRDKIKNLVVTYSLGVNDGYFGGETAAGMFQQYTNAIYPWAAYGAQVKFCDTYQVATNASFVAYSLATETNIFTASQMVRTNILVPISLYVPLRDLIPQSLIQTNGPLSVDGTHLSGRTNSIGQQMIADQIASPREISVTNGPIGPLQ